MLILSKITPCCLAILLFAPALKARFSLNDLLLYLIPAAIFLLALAVSNIARPLGLAHRVKMALSFILLVIPCYFAWFTNGGEALSILLIVAINSAVGMCIVLYPWDSKSLEEFLYAGAFLGLIIAINSIVYFGDFDALVDANEYVQDKYLPVAMAAGIGSIASLYLVAKKLSMLHVGLFVVNWVGLALSRGRGAVLICAAICIVYMFVLLFSQVSTLSRVKKIFVIIGAAFLSPFIVSKLMVLNSGKWNRLFFDLAREIDDGQRGFVMDRALSQIMEAPITGNGLGQYSINGEHPHNLFLQYGVDSGLIGIVLVIIFFALVLRLGLRCVKFADNADANLALGLTGIFVYAIANFMKSGDAYLGRDWYILSALPICLYCALIVKNTATQEINSRTESSGQIETSNQ